MKSNWIEITTVIGCPNMCTYCPQELLLSRYSGKQVLDMKDFMTILNNVPEGIEFYFGGFSEPFINPICMDMIEAVNKRGHKINISTSTVGITDLDIERLIKLDNKQLYLHPTKESDNLRISEILARVKRSVLRTPSIHSRAGNLKHIKSRTYLRKKIKCRYDDMMMPIILPNGDAYLCCMDFGLKYKLGNLLKQKYYQLFESKAYNEVKELQNKANTKLMCRKCVYAMEVN